MNQVVKGLWLVGGILLLAGVSPASQEDIRKLPSSSERYAVVVGVGTYEDKDITSLYGANNDAKVLADSLEKYGGFPKENIALLTSDQGNDRKPTRKNIIDSLSEWAKQVSARGLLVFAFSGHGTQKNDKSVLLPYDTTLRHLTNVIEDEEVIQILKEASVKQVLILLDACRGGPLAAKGNAQDKATPEFLAAFDLQRANIGVRAFATLYATGTYAPDENDGLAYQLRKEEMGVFTWVVTDELRKAGQSKYPLTLAALINRLEVIVPYLVTKEVGSTKRQRPHSVVSGFRANELVLAGPADVDPTSLVPVSGQTLLISRDGKQLQVTDQKTGQVSVYARTDSLSSVMANGVPTPVSVEVSSKASIPLWGSRLLIAPNSEIYVADEKRGGIIVFAGGMSQREHFFIDLNSGKPQQMVLAPQMGEVYVIDGATQTVGIIDVKERRLVHRFQKQNAPRAIAVTPDESKLYVANEQPAPQGSISVIDLKSRELKQSISGVNCPEGLAVSPNGRYLYVSTQCGLGEDPVFVIDTRTDTVIDAIPGLAVGLGGLAITPNGEKLYVARGNYYARDSSSGRLASFPDQISVIDTKSHQVTASSPMNVLLLAATPDGKYILAVDGRRLNFIDTSAEIVVKTIQFDTTPGGIAVGRSQNNTSLLCYVWLPEENRLFFTGLSGVLPNSRN